MGLATIDPPSQKEHTEIHKIPKFDVNQASFYWDSDLKTSKLTKKSMASSDGVRMPIHYFVNFDIFKCLYLAYFLGLLFYAKLGDFVKLGLHFMTMWINSC